MRPDDRCRSNAVSNQKTWAGRAPLRRVLGVRPAPAGCRAVKDSTLVAWYHFSTHLAREGRMTVPIGRRELLVALGGAAVAWPLAARAQQAAMPVVGFLSSRSTVESSHVVAAFREGLAENGYIEGQNLRIEYRWAEGQYDRLPGLASEMVGHKVIAIATAGNTPS